MIYYKSLLTKRNKDHSVVAPPWFINNHFISNQKFFEKSFDQFKLKDFSTKLSKVSTDVSIDRVKSIINGIDPYLSLSVPLGDAQHLNAFNIFNVILALKNNINSNLKIKKNIIDWQNKVLFKSGTSLTTILGALKSYSKRFPNTPNKLIRDALDKLININKEKEKVVFSTNPWDILTMSMRGVSSCMRWESDHSKQLIGSVLDPYCAVIYTTNNEKTAYGKKMLYRSVVRLIRKRSNNDLYLCVDGAYPKIGQDHNTEMTDYYVDILKTHVDKKSEIKNVIAGCDCNELLYYIPITPVIANLAARYRSCVDTEIDYWSPPTLSPEIKSSNKKNTKTSFTPPYHEDEDEDDDDDDWGEDDDWDWDEQNDE